MASADDAPQGLSSRDVNRLRRMLNAYENGNLTPINSPTAQIDESETLLAKVQSVIGVGKYGMTLLQPPTSDIAETGDVAAGDFGSVDTPPSGIKYIAINMTEIGQTHAALSVGAVCRCTVHRHQDSGTIILAIESIGFNDCGNGGFGT